MSGFRELVEAISKGEKIDEDAPKGWEGTVKAMKGEEDVDNPYALAHHMKSKGYTSHKGPRGGSKKKATQVEGRVVEHPIEGRGVVVGLAENQVVVRWDNLSKAILGPETFTFEDAGKYLKLVGEGEYTDDPEDAAMTKNTGHKKGAGSKKNKNKTKKRTDEAWMGEIPGTHRGSSKVDDSAIVFDLTASDIGLLEDDSEGDNSHHGVASDTTDDFETETDNPLSTEDGGESATEEGPREEDNMPDDAPDVPDYREMKDQAGEGNKRSPNRSGKRRGDDRVEKSRKDAVDSQNSEGAGSMKSKANEGLSLADFDTDGLLTESQRGTARELSEMHDDFEDDMNSDLDMDMNGGHEHDPTMKETHDPDSDLAMTRAFAEKLFGAIANQNPDDGMIGTIIDGVLACGAEKGETLDVEDIGSCMAKIKELHAGGDADAEMGDGDMDGDMEMDSDDDGELEYEDKAEGDGEEAGAEAGPEHEGKTKLMADNDGDDDDDDDDGTSGQDRESYSDDQDRDNYTAEGSEDDRMKGQKRTDESFVAMGMAGIQGTHRGNDASIADVDLQEEDDDAEIQMLLRRSGMKYWNN